MELGTIVGKWVLRGVKEFAAQEGVSVLAYEERPGVGLAVYGDALQELCRS